MFFLLLFLAACLIPTSGSVGFIVTSALLCSMMTITTFSFDEHSGWEKYALIMPITRKDYVFEKYLVNLVFITIGVLFGTVAVFAAEIFLGRLELITIIGCAIVGLFLSLLYGSIVIPLMIKYGIEKARIITIGAMAVPALIGFALYKLAVALGFVFTDIRIAAISGIVGIVILILSILSCFLSIRWFEKKEF